MKTMNKLYRTLLMTIALVMGVTNVQAQDIWTGSKGDGESFTVTIGENTINTQTKIRVYYENANMYYWSVGILLDDEANNTKNLISNWGGTDYGTQIKESSNDVNGKYFEFQLNDNGVTALMRNGLTIRVDQGITITKVSLVAGDIPMYTLTFSVDGNAYATQSLEAGATPTLPANNPTKEGYRFLRWDGVPATMPAESVTATALFAQLFTLTYVVDGNTVKTEQLIEGETPTPPADPTKQDYVFVEWTGLPETMPAENKTVEAAFAVRKYDVKFYLDGELVETVQYAPGETIAEKEAPDARTGYTFSGWSGYPENKVMPKWDVNISGQFNKNHHYIVYNKDGNYYDGKYNIPYGATIDPDYLPENNPTKDGYVFDHWEGLPETMPDQDLTVEAVFVSTSAPETPTHALKIVVDGNEETKQVPEGAALSGYLPANPTKTGYTFDVWSNMPEGDVMPTEDWEVTATFTINQYTITYMMDGEQYGDVATYDFGAPITAPAAPSKDGFTFTGWDNLPETMPADNLTINALFDKILNIGENETVIWDGTPAIVYGGENNLFVKNTDDWLTSTDEGSILRIYADFTAADNWKLWTGCGDWSHPTFVDVPSADLTQKSTNSCYNKEKGCFEFEFNDVTKQNLLNHILSDGTAMSISFWGLNIYKVTYEPSVNVPKHTLTFMMDDQQTVIETMQVAEGAEIPAITPPTKTGYVFSSWANMPLSGNMPASDLTLVAVFTEATYTLTFKIGDEVYGEPTQLAYGAPITAPTDVPERTGYTFSGWQNVPETMPAQDLTIIGYYTKEKTYETLSVGSSKYNTFYSTQPLYFQGSESVKAFIAIQYSATEVKLRQVIGAVAANTPLVLKGDAANASANIEVVESGESYGNNLLVGVRQSTSINSPQKYVLVEKSGTVKFADTGNHAATVPANKAYLQAPAGANARQLTIIFEGGVTAIEAISTENDDVPAVFNLSGQQVKNPGKGLYIINGKKVIIK